MKINLSFLLCGFFLLLQGCASHSLYSQITLSHLDRPRNTISLGIAGNGAIASLQYDRIVFSGNKYMLSAMAGVGASGPSASPFVVPHHFTFNLGKKSFLLEAGVGGTIIFSDKVGYMPYDIIGIRCQPVRDKGLAIRVYSHPIAFAIAKEGNSYRLDAGTGISGFSFVPVGISIGYSF